MSDQGSPSDPFGRSDRTIIRPNPAGRARRAPSRPAAPDAAPYAAAGRRPSPGVPGTGEEWLATPQPMAPRAAAAAAARPAGASLPKRDQLLTPERQSAPARRRPAAAAARPPARRRLSSAPPAQLLGQVGDSIEAFEHEVRAAGASAEQTRVAKYVLCATADDIVQNIPGEDRHVWTQYSMLSRFFGERTGGVRFFEELDRAKADPSVNYDLLELMHACLALGFEGIHRTSSGGAANLQMIQRNLFETLRRVKQPDPELSPRWRGPGGRLAGRALQGAGLVGRGHRRRRRARPLFRLPRPARRQCRGGGLRPALGPSRRASSASCARSSRPRRRPCRRRPQPPKVCAAVQPPIVCQVTPNVIIVRLVDITLFEPGQAAVRDEFRPLIERIADVLETERRRRSRCVGHTDNVPIRTARFPSNLELSQARAKAVGELLQDQAEQAGADQLRGQGRRRADRPQRHPRGPRQEPAGRDRDPAQRLKARGWSRRRRTMSLAIWLQDRRDHARHAGARPARLVRRAVHRRRRGRARSNRSGCAWPSCCCWRSAPSPGSR